MRIDCSDEAIARLFHDMGLPAEVLDRFRARLLDEPILALYPGGPSAHGSRVP